MHGLTGGGWKRSVGHGRSESCPGETPGRGTKTYRRVTPPRQPPTLLRTGNAATKFIQADRYVVWRLRTLMVRKRGRNLHAGTGRRMDRRLVQRARALQAPRHYPLSEGSVTMQEDHR